MTPQNYGLPHSTFRPHQEETIEWALDIAGQGQIAFVEQATGSGKSACAAATGSQYKTCVLTKKKALQDAYGEIYRARLLKGKANYPCIHPNKGTLDDTVDDCFVGDHQECPYDCPYDLAKSAVLRSMFSSVNYAYWLSSHDFRKRMDCFLFADEGHLLPDLAINHAGIKITEKERLRWELPFFPLLKTGKGNGVFTRAEDPVEPALKWLKECLDTLYLRENELKRLEDKKALKSCILKARKVQATIKALNLSQSDWYIRSGFMVGGFIAKPLTAKYHFNSYFTQDVTGMVIMSATLGDFDTLAQELGITDFESRKVPSQWPPEARPVHVLDVPRLNRNSSIQDYEQQAKAIAEAIKSCPSDWSGIVHVTRKTEAQYLAQRLSRNGLDGRIWPAPEKYRGKFIGTGERVALWNERRKQYPNSIIVAWDMWEGYDGLDEKITIAAKCPYPNLGDNFEKERMNYSNSMYLQRTAWALMQAMGRTRRGREEDYDTPGEIRGYCAIADMGYTRVMKYLSDDFKESLVKFT